MRILALGFAVLVMAAGDLRAQEAARERAQRTFPPAVFEELSALAFEAGAQGVPEDPIYVKALEGAAKRVPPDRIVPAVREYAIRLREARLALGDGAPVPLLVAGADALQRGVPAEALRSLPSDRPRSPLAVLALAELLESGVPPDRALAILREAARQRSPDESMLDVSARVRRLVRQGVPPQEAIERIRQALRSRTMGPAVPPGSEPITRDRVRNPGSD
jgi:hypothetical protein